MAPFLQYFGDMGLDAIKEAIGRLSDEERVDLESWLADQWDAQIERTSRWAGRIDLLREVDAQIDTGSGQLK